MTILYITQNGVTDHIGRSQVAPYVIGLARLGFRIHVLSAEKSGQDALISEYQQLFDQAGIRWTQVRYRNHPPIFGQALTQFLMKRVARRIIKTEGIKVLHCRSFPSALIAYALKKKFDIKYIFDFRDFYADGGLEKARGPAKVVFWRLKKLEGPMIRNADKVVCLTKQARDHLIDWYMCDRSSPEAHFQIIPCCADFTHFDPSSVSVEDSNRARARAGLRGGECVLLYLGSLGPDYLLPQMIALFRQLLKVIPEAYFVFLSNNGKELVDYERSVQGVDAEHIRFVSADRKDIPAYLSLASMSVFFYRQGLRSVGCSPTKLAELFACNVPVIANSGVGDLDAILNLERNGSVVVKTFDDIALLHAVKQVLQGGAYNIRDNSWEFALEEGVTRYATVYEELLRD